MKLARKLRKMDVKFICRCRHQFSRGENLRHRIRILIFLDAWRRQTELMRRRRADRRTKQQQRRSK